MPQSSNDQQPTESASLESFDTILPPKGVRVDIPTHDKNKSAFWSRQFASTTTPGQIIFDVIFGIIAPILCIIADPVVFRGHIGVLSSYVIIAYFLIAIEILALTLALINYNRNVLLSLNIAGPLILGGIFAGLLGLAILPLSVIGLFAIIGIFGFTPFLTSLVFLRNGVRAIKKAASHFPRHIVVLVFIFTFIMAFVIPVASHIGLKKQVSSDIYTAMEGAESERISAISRLWIVGMVLPISEFDFIVWEYSNVFEYSKSPDPLKSERLKKAYKDITGQDIENRLRQLKD